ncbi:MAG: RecB family exonuclease [Nitriliruptorales bacterium]
METIAATDLDTPDADDDEPGAYGELEPVGPPLVDADGRVRLSASRIDSYTICPLRFRYQYVDRLPGRPSPHLSFGSSIHSALERFYDRKLPEPAELPELLRHLYDAWDSTGFADLSRDEQLRWYRHAQEVLTRFHARATRDFRLPGDVEKWFEMPVGDSALVVGSIDRIDVDESGALEIVDYKTSKRVRDRAEVAASLQLAVYALACEHLYGALPAAVTLDFVVVGLQVRVPIDDIDLDGATGRILEVAAAIRDEAYEPTPNRLCGWCDFRALCPAWEGDGPDVLGPATTELGRLRNQVRRDVAALRQLEAGVGRIRERLLGQTEGGGAG